MPHIKTIFGALLWCAVLSLNCHATCTDHLWGLIVVCSLKTMSCHMYGPPSWPYCSVLSCLKTLCHATCTDHLCGLIVVCCFVLKFSVLSHVQTIFGALLWCAVLSENCVSCHTYRPSLWPYCSVLSCFKTLYCVTCTDHLCGLSVLSCLKTLCRATCTDHLWGLIVVGCLVIKM